MKLFLFLALLTVSAQTQQAGLRKHGMIPGSRYSRGQGNLATCFHGNGRDYQGTVAVSASGRPCLNWERFSHKLTRPEGKHNYCRNHDDSKKPWCYTWTGRHFKREYCDIPRCSPESVSTCGQPKQKQFKIVGGRVTSVESQPWMASIFVKDKFRCGGSLISSCWVLTAAHCFAEDDSITMKDYSVVLGKSAINESDAIREQTFSIRKLVIHEAYEDGQPYNNDIALLRIKGRCSKTTDSVQPVCLPPPNQMLPPGFSCQVVGYGTDEFGVYSQYLKEASVEIISQDDCTQEKYYGALVTSNMFCAGSLTWSTDACKGDSGGPLVCEAGKHAFLFGIVSWGEGCSWEFRPGVYTRVTNYNAWIEEKTGVPGIASGAMYPQK